MSIKTYIKSAIENPDNYLVEYTGGGVSISSSIVPFIVELTPLFQFVGVFCGAVIGVLGVLNALKKQYKSSKSKEL